MEKTWRTWLNTNRQQETKMERSERRIKLKRQKKELKKYVEKRDEAFSRQIIYEDPFESYYDNGELVLRPPFSFEKLYEIYEESGSVRACVESTITNVDGYGFSIVPERGAEYDLTPEEQQERDKLLCFFKSPNGIDSFQTIREKLRRDIEVTGNGFLEVIRNQKNEPHLIFWVDAKQIRLCPIEDEFVETTVQILRENELIPVRIKRQFRKYIMINAPGNFTYFKEYGDPRQLDARTGEYSENPDVPASEIIHFKTGNGSYGVPNWIGVILYALGCSRAEYINFDLFDGQALPPLIVTVAGGELTDESFEDLLTLLTRAKGVENFHKFLLLEAESTTLTPDGRAAVPKIEIQDLLSYRKEDALFSNYLDAGHRNIRMFGFRLPGIFIGDHTGVNFATAKISRELAEEQLFIPLRKAFDDLINNTICRDLGARNFRFRTNGPVIKSSQDVISIFPQLMKSSVFSLNELVQFANENFGLNLRSYEGEWANLPVTLLLYLFQSLGMALGAGMKEGTLPNALGSMKPIVDTGKSFVEQFLGRIETQDTSTDQESEENENEQDSEY